MSYSILEAFRQLNNKSGNKKATLKEAAGRVKRLPIAATATPPDYLCRDLLENGDEDDIVRQYYLDSLEMGETEADLQLVEIYLSPWECEGATPADYLDGDWWVDKPFGMKLANGDYVYTDPDTEGYPLYVKCYDLNQLKDYLLGNLDPEEDA